MGRAACRVGRAGREPAIIALRGAVQSEPDAVVVVRDDDVYVARDDDSRRGEADRRRHAA